jgi:hypothetical protein
MTEGNGSVTPRDTVSAHKTMVGTRVCLEVDVPGKEATQ